MHNNRRRVVSDRICEVRSDYEYRVNQVDGTNSYHSKRQDL